MKNMTTPVHTTTGEGPLALSTTHAAGTRRPQVLRKRPPAVPA